MDKVSLLNKDYQLEQLYSHIKKKSRHRLTSFTKNNSKWIRDLNIEHRTIKLLEDNIRKNLDGYGNDFLDTTPKLWPKKERTDKLDFIKIKNVCSEKKTLSKEWENNPQTGRKYLQKTHLIRDCYPKYTKNFSS